MFMKVETKVGLLCRITSSPGCFCSGARSIKSFQIPTIKRVIQLRRTGGSPVRVMGIKVGKLKN